MNVTNLPEQERFFNDKQEYTKDEILERTKKLEKSSLKGDETSDVLKLRFPVYNDHIKIIYFEQIRFDELERKIYIKSVETLFPVK